MPLNKQQRLTLYYCGLADFLETIRWEYFTHKHEISEFVPYGLLDLEYFSLNVDGRKDMMGTFYPDGDPFIHYDYLGKGVRK